MLAFTGGWAACGFGTSTGPVRRHTGILRRVCIFEHFFFEHFFSGGCGNRRNMYVFCRRCLLLREAALRFSHDQILILAERLNPHFFQYY